MNIAKVLVQHYNLKPRCVTKLDGGFRNQCFRIFTNEKKQYVCIIYKSERGIDKLISNAHIVADFLKTEKFPVRYPIQTLRGEDFIKHKDGGKVRRIAVYNYLPGRTIPWEAYTRRHLKSMGKTLSDIHYTLSQHRGDKSQSKKSLNRKSTIPHSRKRSESIIEKLPKWWRITRKEIEDMLEYFNRVEPWIEKKLKVKLDWDSVKAVLGDLVEDCRQFPSGVLHYDFTRGNIVFSSKLNEKLDVYPIVGILDLEKVCYGPMIADIARTLAFLMVDCKYKDEQTVRKRFLQSGYQKRGNTKLAFDTEFYRVLDRLIAFFWLRDFWKFLEHNPYEYLYMNEHYLRTKNLLLKVNLLTESKLSK